MPFFFCAQSHFPFSTPQAATRCCRIVFHAGSPAERQLFRTDFRFAPSPRRASLAGPPIHEDMVVHGLCGRVTDSARNACSLNCCCLVGGAGDLQEGYFALPDANFLSSWCQFPFSRAQNRHFCALLPSETPVFGLFEHKIEVFVLFWPSEPSFSGFSSTKSAFLCSGRRGNCVGKGSLTSVNK